VRGWVDHKASWTILIGQKSLTDTVIRTTISQLHHLSLTPCTGFLLREEYLAKNTFLLDPSADADVTRTANLNRSHTQRIFEQAAGCLAT
jgi:hypothetical protein